MKTMNLYEKDLHQDSGFLTKTTNNEPTTYEINGFTWIGRDPAAPILINDEFASLRHARVERVESGFIIRDLRSLNGTYVNGSRVNEAPLRDQDRIRIGVTEIVFTHENKLNDNSLFLISRNAKWNAELQRLPAIAQSPHPVLILGPSGSGKEVIAHLIHKYSARHNRSFLSVNCSALTEALIESELFGHTKGSFTGALSDRKGAFESARGGTLFLDEIGDLPLNLQPKLLRALENCEIKPVGSDKTISTDVRIVAATNQLLEQRVAEGRFRADLFFRLHILQIHPPALTDRSEDLDELIRLISKDHSVRFASDAYLQFHKYHWPGNIRELKNIIMRAAAIYPRQTVNAEDLKQLMQTKIQEPKLALTHSPTLKSMQEIERDLIIDRMRLFNGNQRRVAFDLGMPKSTLHDRMKRYSIVAKDYRYRPNNEKESI